jgi:hypothetical protein
MVEGAVPGQPDTHDTHAGTVPDPAVAVNLPARSPGLNLPAGAVVYPVEMPADRRRPVLPALLLAVLAAGPSSRSRSRPRSSRDTPAWRR